MPLQIVPAGTKIDFIGKRNLCAAISSALLLAGVAGYLVLHFSTRGVETTVASRALATNASAEARVLEG